MSDDLLAKGRQGLVREKYEGEELFSPASAVEGGVSEARGLDKKGSEEYFSGEKPVAPVEGSPLASARGTMGENAGEKPASQTGATEGSVGDLDDYDFERDALEEEVGAPLASARGTMGEDTGDGPASREGTGDKSGSHEGSGDGSGSHGGNGSGDPDEGEQSGDEDWESLLSETREVESMDDLLRVLEERKAAVSLPTREQLERERRRRRANAIIASISDAGSALANLIFTSKDAPDMSSGGASLSSKMRERYERLKADRERDEERYLNYVMSIAKVKEGLNEKKYERGRDALQDRLRMLKDEREEAKADRDAQMADLRMRLMEKKISQAEYEAEIKRIESEYRDKLLESKVKLNNRNASKPSRGGGSKGGGKGSKAKYPIYDSNNNVVGRAHTKDEAVMETHKRGGSYPKKQSRTTNDGVTRTTTSEYVVDKKPKKKIGWCRFGFGAESKSFAFERDGSARTGDLRSLRLAAPWGFHRRQTGFAGPGFPLASARGTMGGFTVDKPAPRGPGISARFRSRHDGREGGFHRRQTGFAGRPGETGFEGRRDRRTA